MRHKGPWNGQEIDSFLRDAVIPLRLGCQTGSGWPLVLSLWFLYREGALWCASAASSRVVQLLSADSRCAFEVGADAPPYRGVRGRGRASLHPARAEETLRALIDRYLGTDDSPLARWLLGRVDREVAIRVEPHRLMSWDYTERMTAD